MAHDSRPPGDAGHSGQSGHAARMAELARALHSTRTTPLTLQRVVEATRELVPGCEDVAVSLAHPDGSVETRATLGSGLAEQADQLQARYAEGPCFGAGSNAGPESGAVRVDDLGESGPWPRWGPAARDQLDLHSVLAAPLHADEDSGLGVLQLFSTRPAAFDTAAAEELVEIAAQAAVALGATADHEALQFGLVRRTVIGQATGILMERHGVSAHEAFEVLRRASQEGGRKVYDLALELVEPSGPDVPGEPGVTVK